jgi:hypothetical protein
MNILFERFVSASATSPPTSTSTSSTNAAKKSSSTSMPNTGATAPALTAEVISYRRPQRRARRGQGTGACPLDASSGSAKSSASRGICPSTSAASSSPADRSPRWSRSRTRRWRTAPSSSGTRTTRSLGMLKVDVLALGMLTCIRKAFAFSTPITGRRETLASLPMAIPRTYDMICRADTVGVFQIESRAQMSMLPRLKPRCYYDLVIEVAIVRPGRSRATWSIPTCAAGRAGSRCPFPRELRGGAGQDAGRAAVSGAGDEHRHRRRRLLAGEADKLRRAMATFRRVGTIGSFQKKMVAACSGTATSASSPSIASARSRALANMAFPKATPPASRCWSMSLLAQVPLSRMCFAPPFLNSQPMGFYAPAQIRDAREHGRRERTRRRGAPGRTSAWSASIVSLGVSPRTTQRLVVRVTRFGNVRRSQSTFPARR